MGAVVLGRLTDVPRGRAVGWGALVVALGAIGYAGRAAGGEPDRDVLYRYSTAIGGLVQFAIIAGIILLLARGLDLPAVLALRRPRSWRRAIGLSGLALVSIWIVGLALSPFLDAGKDQGLVPKEWEPSRAGAYVANFLVVVLVAPLIEETLFRGFGITALERVAGGGVAVVATAVGWGLAHGLVTGLPLLVAFGIILGVLRLRTDSVLPGMFVHAVFNATALVLAVTVGTSS
jgi:membrane protease YdiL (CAAX protease family)